MSSLTDEVLSSISHIHESAYDAEIRVTEALMADTLRQIKMETQLRNCGVIQEGDIIPKRDGENIFKYIFLWIPRVIINICKKIKQWWNNRKKAFSDSKQKAADELLEKRIQATQQMIMAAVGDPRFVPFGTQAFGYVCRTRDLSSAHEVYEWFADLFENYEGLFDRIITGNNRLALKDVVFQFTDDNKRIDIRNATSKNPEFVHKIVPDADFRAIVKELQPIINSCCDRVIKAMRRVLTKQDEMLKHYLQYSTREHELAKKFAEGMTAVYNRFQEFDVAVETDVNLAGSAVERFWAYFNTMAKEEKDNLSMK